MAGIHVGGPPVAPASASKDYRVGRALAAVRGRGGRWTSVRHAVLNVLASSPGHLTVSQIHDRLDAAGSFSDRTAVARSLAVFGELGLVHTLPTPGDAAYGLAEPPHHHAICVLCGEVTEIPPISLADALDSAERTTGFALRPTGLVLHGVCPECQRRSH